MTPPASPGLRGFGLAAMISGLLLGLPDPGHPLVLASATCLVVLLATLMLGSLVAGLTGAVAGLICAPACVPICAPAYGPLLGAILAWVVGIDRSRQRRGRPAWFAAPWLLTAGLVVPPAMAVLMGMIGHRTLDLLPALSLSLMLLGAVGGAMVALGRPGQPPVDGWTILNTLCGYATFAMCCLGLMLALPLMACLPRLGRLPCRQRLLTSLMRWGMRLVLRSAPGVRWEMGGDPAPLAQARVVVANHHSFLDILCLCALPGEERTFLAKPWVLRAPLLGWIARACGIVSTEAVEASDFLDGGSFTARTMAIFPSGRREDDLTPARFRPGAFVLAGTWRTPVLPVALGGTALAVPRSTWWIRPCRLSAEVLPPLTRGADESVRQFAERCRILIQEARTRRLVDDLRLARQRRWLSLWTIGHGPRVRLAMRREEASAGPLAGLLRRPVDARPWLIVGLGWSTSARTLRLLYPHTPLLAVEADRRRREVALATWFRPATDRLETALPGELPRLAGILIAEPTTRSCEDAVRLRRACDARTQILLDAHWTGGRTAEWGEQLAGDLQRAGDGWWQVLPDGPPASAIEPATASATVST